MAMMMTATPATSMAYSIALGAVSSRRNLVSCLWSLDRMGVRLCGSGFNMNVGLAPYSLEEFAVANVFALALRERSRRFPDGFLRRRLSQSRAIICMIALA
jgi:hypothetical protein